MKGLLLKDWYMMKKDCRWYLLLAVIFSAVSFFSDENYFLIFYPCLLCGMIPVSLLGYDEKSGWMYYSATMPYTKAQLVSAKYLVGLLAQGVMLLISGIIHSIKLMVEGHFNFAEFGVFMILFFVIATFAPSISMPFVFKYGVEKGRMGYYIMVGFFCAASIIAQDVLSGKLSAEIQPNAALIVVAVIGIGLYVLSWYKSIAYFRKREL